ncbi:MAG: hypothetical protein AAB403_22005 [Planctomycetota bacterium]
MGRAIGTRIWRRANQARAFFAKSHRAYEDWFSLIRYQHVSLRIVPANQQYWSNRLGSSFDKLDQYDNRYFTFGAGPPNGDTGGCSPTGPLTSAPNRVADLNTAPSFPLEKLSYRPSTEDELIEKMLARDQAYDDNLLYACFPENNDGYYNSNSFAAGLINAVGLPLPRRPSSFPALYPGWRKPIPNNLFY